MALSLLVPLCLVLLAAAFGACRLLARRIRNYGIIDILWTYSFLPVVLLAAGLEPGWKPRRALIAALAAGWSLRLGTHVLRRVARAHPEEDLRYGQLRREWGGAFEARMTGFFQLQALSVVVLSLPFFAACHNPFPGWTIAEIAGVALWAIGWAGEAIADGQLAAFKRRPTNRGRICRAGLWRYSRHPNYFFESITWIGFFVFGCGSPWGVLGIVSPALILYFLLRVTGIPLTEEQSVRSRGDAYRRYQQTTSPFVPWFPRRGRSR